MSVYDVNDTGDLYGAGEFQPEEEQPEQPAEQQPPQPSASDAVAQSLEVLASPATLLSEVLPPNPADSKLPMGLAVLGACAVAVIWANSISGGKK